MSCRHVWWHIGWFTDHVHVYRFFILVMNLFKLWFFEFRSRYLSRSKKYFQMFTFLCNLRRSVLQCGNIANCLCSIAENHLFLSYNILNVIIIFFFFENVDVNLNSNECFAIQYTLSTGTKDYCPHENRFRR